MEWQVSNFELSKKLKELNCKQESLWYWLSSKGANNFHLLSVTEKMVWQNEYYKEEFDKISAFTVAELGKMLPVSFKKIIKGIEQKAILKLNKYSNSMYQILYDFRHPSNFEHNLAVVADTEADARAKMLIYLLENKLMEIEK